MCRRVSLLLIAALVTAVVAGHMWPVTREAVAAGHERPGDRVTSGANQSDALSFDLVGATGGAATSLAVRDGLAYVGAGSAIDVYDVTRRGAPRLVGSAHLVAPRPGRVVGIVVVGNHAYATVQYPGLPGPAAAPGQAAREGERLSASDEAPRGELWVLDLADPRAPSHVGAVPLEGRTGRLATVGDRLVVPSVPSLLAFELTRPAEPQLVARAHGWSAENVVCSNGIAYGVDGRSELVAADLSTDSPSPDVSHLSLDGKPESVAVVDGVAYVTSERYAGPASTTSHLAIVDARDPERLLQVGTYPLPEPEPGELTCVPHGIWSLGRTLAVSTLRGHTVSDERSSSWSRDSLGILTFVDVAEPLQPRVVGAYRFELGITASDVALHGDLLYLTATGILHHWSYVEDDVARAGGLRVLDGSVFAAARELGRIVPLARAVRLASVGDTLFVAEADESGDRTAPDRLHTATADRSGAVRVRGTVGAAQINGLAAAPECGPCVLLATGSDPALPGAVQLIDGSDPARPLRRGSYEAAGIVRDAAWSSPHAIAIVETQQSGQSGAGSGLTALVTVDFTDPARPRQIGALPLEGGQHLALDDHLAYVANCGTHGLCVADLHDPARPRLVPYAGEDTVYFFDVAAFRGTVYGTSMRLEADESPTALLTRIDATEPARWHVLAATRVASGFPYGLSVQGAALLVTTSDLRAILYDVRDPALPRRLGEARTADQTQGAAIHSCRLAVADRLAGLQLFSARPSGSPPSAPRPPSTPSARWHSAYLPRVDGGYSCPLEW